ncbi:MAG TPA: hypothetical protein VLF61_01050, partial [Rhabdochlamydiaceae bacterium]|nr:hypothetical protein [Rhabdochlamydiaceae bacterium]
MVLQRDAGRALKKCDQHFFREERRCSPRLLWQSKIDLKERGQYAEVLAKVALEIKRDGFFPDFDSTQIDIH